MPFDFTLHDDAFDIDPFILNDLPFDAYYPLELVATHVMSGGAQSGGSALLRMVRLFTGSGGGVSGGAAAFVRTNTYTMQGGAIAGGSATMVYVPAQPQPQPQPSGGWYPSIPFHVPMLPAVRPIRIYRYTMQGGGVAGGSAGMQYSPAHQGSGGALAGGEAGLQLTRTFAYVCAPSDIFRPGGSAIMRIVRRYESEPQAVVAGGSAIMRRGRDPDCQRRDQEDQDLLLLNVLGVL